MKRVSYFLFLIIVNCSAVFAKNKTPDHIMYADQVMKAFIQEMEQKYGWVCIGDGGRMPSQIEDIFVEFALPRRATIEEARALEVLAIERLAEMVNSNEKVKPYLYECPFPSHRAEVALSFYTPLGSPLADGSLARVSQIRNRLHYAAIDPMTGRLTSLLEEPYSEAKKIVDSSPPKDLFVHQEKPYEPLIDAIFLSYLKEMFNDYQLECERIGGKLTNGVEEIVARLIYFHPTRIDKARELQVVATEKLLQAINNNENLKPYIKDYPLSLDRLKVIVLFRKSNYFPYFDGSLEGVYREGTEISYLIDEDDDVLDQMGSTKSPLFAKESYQEALTKIKTTKHSKKMKLPWRLSK